MKLTILERLDHWGHRHNVPNIIQSPLCWLLDWSVGLFDDDDNNYVRRKKSD